MVKAGLASTSNFEWAASRIDVNSVLFYMNVFGIGLGGFVTLIASAYPDYWCEYDFHSKADISRS